MTEPPLVVGPDALRAFILTVLDRWGTPPSVALLTADLMIRTDLRGVDSHGVGMLPTYLKWYRAGYIVPGGEPKVVRDEGTTAVVDGQQAFGHAVATLAMELSIAKARTHGVGFVTCYNSNHFGAAANYSMMALPHDMIGISLTNGPWPAVVPTFGRQSMLSTNPISLAAPAGREYPFVLDMATSTVAIGKLSVAARWARPIPEGWALDATGRPTTDAALAYETRLLTPLGGSREQGGHKGYGLALMVDILCGVLAGASWAAQSRRAEGPSTRADIGHFFGAIDVARFRPLEVFKADMDELLRALKESPKADGHERIYVAGEPEWECEQRRRREGIPLAPGLVAQLSTVAAEAGVPFNLGTLGVRR
ncbi:MAG: malate dehydrogenase [Candidatus Rokuibacteriota bacterium]|nr:MAG: malate dehydrogenase [Candidatus Rokubacteria bacterium]